MIFIQNYHGSLESSKIEFGMILVIIWYDYHTSVFVVYDEMHVAIYSQDRNMHDCDTTRWFGCVYLAL